MTKKCPKCGVLNADDVASCSECGKDITEVKIDSSKIAEPAVDKPNEVLDRVLGFLLTWDLRTNLIIWLTFVMAALLLGLLLMIIRI